MMIYSMQATFGKLEHETLILQPGLNLLEAPNEWGKSTWCAFLETMLYGMDTRGRNTKSSLAAKERFAPWSGSPMSGRIDLCWNGRDITIERTTVGRVPMGNFRAYETATGTAVPELTAENCGVQLVGVERSVFLRSAFLRLSDLPLTDDEALRRRLHALVTTGDESGAGERLGKELKELKNRCSYRKTGLLPQAEEQRAQLLGRLEETDALKDTIKSLTTRLEQTERQIRLLENHRSALNFAAAQRDAQKVAQAGAQLEEAEARLQTCNETVKHLPDREQVRWMLDRIDRMEGEAGALQMEAQLMGQEPEPIGKPSFAGSETPEETMQKVQQDQKLYRREQKARPLLLVIGILLAMLGAALAFRYLLPGIAAAAVGAAVIAVWAVQELRRRRTCSRLAAFYGCSDPQRWIAETESYVNQWREYQILLAKQRAAQQEIDERTRSLEEKIRHMTQGRGLERCRMDWLEAQHQWDDQLDAARDRQRAEQTLKALQTMAKTASRPAFRDELTLSEEDTAYQLTNAYSQRNLLGSRISQYTGKLEALGSGEDLSAQLEVLDIRIKKLEEINTAISIAQDTLAEAASVLRQRFAPGITEKAQQHMRQLTDGRYDRIRLGEDFSVQAGTVQEDTLREALWRSDGTMDQMYLAMRLAVAEELMPDSPLILDDALVRFDDVRLKAALQLLQKQAENRQILLFSCQSREKQLIEN